MYQTMRYTRSTKMNAFRSAAPITNDEIRRFAPSILAEHAHDSRSSRYAFIPTVNILDGLRKEGFQPYEIRQARTKTEDKREAAKHLIRLRHESQGDKSGECAEIILLNSHDGSSSYKLMSGVFRMVCSNGLIAGDMFQDVTVQHKGDIIGNVIEGSYQVLKEAQNVIEHVDNFKGLQLSRDEQRLLAAASIPLRFDVEEDKPAPVTVDQLLRINRRVDDKDDLWTVFNTLQENLIRGGISTRNPETRRRSSTREVSGIDQNVKINRALWTLAEGMAKLKAA
jgi:hypothetical protein